MDNASYEDRLSELEKNQEKILLEQKKINSAFETIHDLASVAAVIHEDAEEIARNLSDFKEKVSKDISSIYKDVIKVTTKSNSLVKIAGELRKKADDMDFNIQIP
jgi:DNA repair ATPase RecN